MGQHPSHMKKVLLIATGGTIASLPQDDGLTPILSGRELAAYVPQLTSLCELDFVQPMNTDSTNLRPSDWLMIAHTIEEVYTGYDGFVILHGTDTMAYTAAALSYLIQDSPKPIVLTGSQQPMTNPFTDAKLNLYQSVLYALDPCAHDVCVCFGGQIIAGTRAHKQRTLSYNAFASMNFPTLALMRGERVIREMGHAADARRRSVSFFHDLDERVIVLKLTPELKPSIFGLLRHDYQAIILETFGIGGIPEYDDGAYRKAIFGWVNLNRTLVITTQVPEEGLDLGVYEVGRAYANHPSILRAADMTTEALVAKTMWALGQTKRADEVARLFYTPVNHDRATGD